MQHEKAGNYWATGFLKRHNDISLRTPESTSIQRMANLNEATVGLFLKDLEKVLSRYGGFSADQIWSVD